MKASVSVMAGINNHENVISEAKQSGMAGAGAVQQNGESWPMA